MESQHPKDVTLAAIAAVHELVPQIAVLAKIPDWLRMQSWRCPELARPSAWFQGEDGSWAAIVEALNRPKGGKLRAVYDLLVAMGLPIYDYVSLDWDHRGTRRKFYRTPLGERIDDGRRLPPSKQDLEDRMVVGPSAARKRWEPD